MLKEDLYLLDRKIMNKEEKIMVQYIDKSALVAEINRRIKVLQGHSMENHKTICHLDSLKQSLDTLEVKEVNFEKIWKEYFKYRGDVATVNVKHLAKHFFELGMTSSNKAQKGEEV